MRRQIRCSVRGVFSAEVDVIEPHDTEAGRLTVSRVLYFFCVLVVSDWVEFVVHQIHKLSL